jgi:hypothetical protein
MSISIYLGIGTTKTPLFENSSDDEKENSPEKVKKVVAAYKSQLFPESLI